MGKGFLYLILGNKVLAPAFIGVVGRKMELKLLGINIMRHRVFYE